MITVAADEAFDVVQLASGAKLSLKAAVTDIPNVTLLKH